MKKFKRFRFLKAAAGTLLGVLAAQLSAPLAWAEKFYHEPPWRKKKPYWGFGIDIDKCIGCTRCMEACKTENDVPDHPFYYRTWVERYALRRNGEVQVETTKDPKAGIKGYTRLRDTENITSTFFVPKMCNLCEESPCVQVCPVGATFRTPDGVVLIDKEYCIGCRYCIQACPYGTRFFNPITKTADKCSLCYHRISRGLKTACAEVCPTGARIFGDLSDPNSEITKFRENNIVRTLKPHLGTHPKLAYKGLHGEVR